MRGTGKLPWRDYPSRILGLGLFGLGLVFAFFALDSGSLAHAQSPTRLTLIQSDANRVVVELELDGYTAREQRVGGTIYTALAVPDLGLTGERGNPQMPVKGTFIGIPPGAQATLKILADDTRTDTLARPPLPAPTKRISTQPGSRLPRDLGDVIIPNTATYSANQNYPADAARITSVGDWRSQHFVVVEFHPLQYNPATRQLLFHRRMRVEITLSYPRGMSAQAVGGALNEGAFEEVFQKSFINYASAKNWRAKSAPSLSARRSWAPASSQTWFKLGVNADGIYQMTCPQLQGAGGPASLDPGKLQVFKQGGEVAINVAGTWSTCTSSDYIEFFGQKANTKYTDTNIYWLTFETASVYRMGFRDGTIGSGKAATPFTDTLHIERNLNYISMYPALANYQSPPNENFEHWYWDAVGAWAGIPFVDHPSPEPIDYLASGNYSATLQVNLVGYQPDGQTVPVTHTTVISVNNNLIGDITSYGSVTTTKTFTFPQSFMNVGTNTIRVDENKRKDDGTPIDGDLVYVDNFNLSYTRPFTASSDTLRFRQSASGPWQYQITGFTNSNIELFDITDPSNVAQITGTITSGTPYSTLQFADASAPPREYIALTTARRKTPTITRDVASDLTSNGADYIIISHGDFIPIIRDEKPVSVAKTLGELRGAKIVDVQDVYDEFNYVNYGAPDPQAIRDYLLYAYEHWGSHFVLLVGDGTYDPKGYCVTGCDYATTLPTLIPPYLRMVDPWLGETASDNRFVSFCDGTGGTLPSFCQSLPNVLPQMSIGRLPANTKAEARAMVTKTLEYEQNPQAGSWRSMVTFVADSKYTPSGDVDGAGDFWAASDEIYDNALYTPFSLGKERIYYNACSSCPAPLYPTYTSAADAENAIKTSISAGRVIVNYTGHGGNTLWGYYDSIFTTNDVGILANGSKLPVMLEMTCMTGYFHDPQLSSLAETNMRAAGKGALASWAPAGWGLVSGHGMLHKGFLNAVMTQGERRLGSAILIAKGTLEGSAYEDLIDTYTLFGDPASRLQIEFRGTIYFPFIRRQ